MENQDHQFEYFAFISYKREDEKWAKWLQHKLESYNLPTAVRKTNPELPKKIRPIFRDQSDLAGGNLKEEIEKALDRSKFLIVICSPKATKSPWVSNEVQRFIDQGREDFIIPFIIDGTPNASNPEEECFPEGLRKLTGDKEILGINVKEMGRDAAAVKVVARLFGLKFDSLWQRYRRRQFRKRFFFALFIVAFVVLGVFAFNYFKTTREYYANYEFCFGMPMGINRLDKDDLKTLYSYYVFESTRGKLRRVYLSNTFGHPLDENSSWSHMRTAILDLGYEGDKLSSITFSDANNNPQYKYVYNNDYHRVDIKNTETGDAASMFKSTSSTSENMIGTVALDFNNLFLNTKSQVARYVYDYDFWGYISKIHFKRYNGSNETGYDDSGISGIEYDRDSLHRVVRKRYLDENDQYMADKMGCAGCEYRYNERGNLVYERFFNLKGENHLSDMGYAISRDEYDYRKAEITESHYDIDDKPVMTIANYHKAINIIKGDTIISSFFDTEGQPTYMSFSQRQVGPFHKLKTVYDSHGNPIENSCFGTDGAPCYDMMRIHRTVCDYDDRGRCIKNTVFNINGEYQICATGVCEVKISYDGDSNNPKSFEYFRQPGIPANIGNLSKRVFTYSSNRLVKSACYDSNNMPSYSPANLDAHIVTLEYDDFGNVSDVWLKDVSGFTDYMADTFSAHIKASYKNGNCTKIEYFNKYGKPAMTADGCSSMIMEYDEKGRRTMLEYRDTLGLPFVAPSVNYAKIESHYDSQGHEIETRTYGSDLLPIICNDGWAVKKTEYKDYMPTRISCYDENGNPTSAKFIEAHIKTSDYDKSRRIISDKYYGLNNEPTLTSFGISEVRYKYNSQGQMIEATSYDTSGRPVNSKYDFCRASNEFDSRNNLVAIKFYDTKGHLATNSAYGYAVAISQYNDMGQLLSSQAFDSDSLPTDNIQGIHLILNKYTTTGDQIMCAFLNKEHKPVMSGYGNEYLAVFYNKYDEEGRFRGYVSFDNELNEIKIGAVIIENGKECGVIWRDYGGNVRLRRNDGTEKEIGPYSTSPSDKAYIEMLDAMYEYSKDEVKRLIIELT